MRALASGQATIRVMLVASKRGLVRRRPAVKLAVVAAAAVSSALFTTTVAAAAGTHAAAGARFTVSGGIWGTAQKVPAPAPLGKDGFASIQSVSCASPGNCGAGGTYGPNGDPHAFVVGETNGAWGTAKKVAGFSGTSSILSMSCGSPGNCSAAGYAGFATGNEGFVVDEVNGTWGTAHLVALNRGTSESVSSVSCASAGNCSAGGDYENSSLTIQAYVVDEVNGIGAPRRRSPALRPSARAGSPSSARCRVPQRATAAPPAGTNCPLAYVRCSSWTR